MRMVKRDLRHGTVVLKIENADDLWHLGHILAKGDRVKSRTMRKVALKTGGEIKMSDKKPMTLEIGIENMSFDETSGSLRVSGRITEGPETTRLSSYHTLQVKPGTVITVRKARWASYHMKRIRDSAARQPSLLICVLDREGADIAAVRGSGISVVGRVECDDPENREKYHSEIIAFLMSQDGYDRAVIAGPGFEAENVMKMLRKKHPEKAGMFVLEKCSHAGIPGINEVLKKSSERVLRETRIGTESALVEEILARMKSDGAVAYGREEVARAVEMGAVEVLAVSSAKVDEFEPLMEKCEKMQGKVSIISADHSSGEQFLHLGGIAALLRFIVRS